MSQGDSTLKMGSEIEKAVSNLKAAVDHRNNNGNVMRINTYLTQNTPNETVHSPPNKCFSPVLGPKTRYRVHEDAAELLPSSPSSQDHEQEKEDEVPQIVPIYTDIKKNQIIHITKKQHSSQGSIRSSTGLHESENNDIIKDLQRISSAHRDSIT